MVERSTNNPLGCCLNSSLLAVGAGGSVADFDHQVDHVMTRDPDEITLKSSIGDRPQPVNGFWDSDHAGPVQRACTSTTEASRTCAPVGGLALAGGAGDEFGDFFGLLAR